MIRTFFKVLIFASLLVSIAAGVVWWKLDAVLDLVRPEITTRLSTALERPVSIASLRAQVFPSLRIVGTGIKIEPELHADEIVGDVELRPLLRGEIRIRSLSLVKPRLEIDQTKPRLDDSVRREEKNAEPRGSSSLSILLSEARVVSGELRFLSAQGTRVVSGIRLLAQGSLSPEAVRLSSFELSGSDREIGNFSFVSPGFEYQALTHRISLKNGAVQFGEVSSKLDGEWNIQSQSGEIFLELRETSIASLGNLLEVFSPQTPAMLRAYRLDGKISPSIKVHGSPTGLETKITGSLKNMSANVLGVQISKGSGEYVVDMSGRGSVATLSKGSVALGTLAEAVSLSGEYSITEGTGSATISAPKMTFETIRPFLGSVLPTGLKLDSAETSVNGALAWGKATSVEGKLNFSEMSGEYNGTAFRRLRGPLEVTYRSGSGTARSSRIDGELQGAPANAAFDIRFPEVTGTLAVDIPSVGVGAVLALSGVSSLPWAQRATGTLSGRVDGRIDSKSRKFTGSVRFTDVSLPALTPPISALNAQFQISPGKEGYLVNSSDLVLTAAGEKISGKISTELALPDFVLHSVKLNAFGGSVDLSGAVEIGGRERLRVKVEGRDFEAQRVANVILGDGAVSLQGAIKSVKGEARGSRAEGLASSLSGPVSFKMADGLLKGVNLGRVALQKVDNLPIFQGRLYDRMSPELKQYFEGEDTVIRELTGSGDLRAGGLDIREITLLSEQYAVRGRGRYDFDAGADMGTEIAFSPGFSSALQQHIYETKRLMDRRGILVFPLEISGKPPGLSVLPDLKGMVERALSNVIEKKAGDLLNDLLAPKPRQPRSAP